MASQYTYCSLVFAVTLFWYIFLRYLSVHVNMNHSETIACSHFSAQFCAHVQLHIIIHKSAQVEHKLSETIHLSLSTNGVDHCMWRSSVMCLEQRTALNLLSSRYKHCQKFVHGLHKFVKGWTTRRGLL